MQRISLFVLSLCYLCAIFVLSLCYLCAIFPSEFWSALSPLAPRVPAIHTCAPSQFLCDNKKCIPYVWKCDNDHDCGGDDRSDEPSDCVTAQPCRSHYIKCRSTGRCIPETWKCDGDKDCGILDDTDEPVGECSEWSTFIASLPYVVPLWDIEQSNILLVASYLTSVQSFLILFQGSVEIWPTSIFSGCSSSPFSPGTPMFCHTQTLVLYSVQLICRPRLRDHN